MTHPLRTDKILYLGRESHYAIHMNPKKVLRSIAPKKAIHLAEETYRKGRLGTTHLIHGLPARRLRVIAVTGTNGKTSTCNFLNDVLHSLGYKTAMFTTAVVEMDGERSINTNHTTVPKTSELFRFLKLAKIKKVDFVILEITSHALHQHKVWGIPIEIAVMTNISQDHLDYHGTMQAYASAKARLFSNYMKPIACVLNRDDEWFEFFEKRAVGRVVTYGKSDDSTLRISSLKEDVSGVTMRLESRDGTIIATSPVIGEFNAYNLSAVASIALLLDAPIDQIRKALESVDSIPGRMEMIRSSDGFTAVVDYAHAPDALEKALVALRQAGAKSVSVVFGATGDRDKTKRPIMGRIASKYADKVYLTDDETYTEDGNNIRGEVYEGIVAAKGRSRAVEIADRREAIKKALIEAKPGDMILIAGLGHQNYRAMNDGNIPWQESEVVREILEEIGRA
jgi:UDP-N-acetylmuramoyl-L-alanyl-D-glutamate--2,6-diaminopimelate ligase